MKIIMKKTDTAEDKDGTVYVFGPAGREYSTDDGRITKEMADSLMKDKSAEKVSTTSKSKPLEVENDVAK